jgi:hypothetical protein
MEKKHHWSLYLDALVSQCPSDPGVAVNRHTSDRELMLGMLAFEENLGGLVGRYASRPEIKSGPSISPRKTRRVIDLVQSKPQFSKASTMSC